MEPDWRGRLLEKGLCGVHLRRLFEGSARLGMAILTKSLVDQAGEMLETNEKSRKPVSPAASCLACSDLEEAFCHYVDSFLLTYKREADFREKANRSALCLPHLWEMLRYMGQKRWRDIDLEKEFLTSALQRLQGVQKDLDWFIKKFDYRFDNEPWNGAEDALERALSLLGAENVGK